MMLFPELSEAPSPSHAEFDRLWSDYPRKDGKRKARTAFEKAIKKTTLDKILTAVAWRKTTKQWRTVVEGIHIYVPHLATWLNQERYDDPIPTSFRSPVTPPPVTPAQAEWLTDVQESMKQANQEASREWAREYYRKRPWMPMPQELRN